MQTSRALIVAVATAWLTAGLAGCTEPAELTPTTTASTTAAVTPSPSASDDTGSVEAAVLDVWGRWWAASVQAEAGNPDPALFDGIATSQATEAEIAVAQQNAEQGIVRDGQPTLTQATVRIDGEAATVVACVDHRTWPFRDMDSSVLTVQPTQVDLVLQGGSWLVADQKGATAGVTC